MAAPQHHQRTTVRHGSAQRPQAISYLLLCRVHQQGTDETGTKQGRKRFDIRNRTFQPGVTIVIFADPYAHKTCHAQYSRSYSSSGRLIPTAGRFVNCAICS